MASPEYSGRDADDKCMYHTYIIQSESSGKYYIGSTEDLDKRLEYHNEGLSKWTKNKGPWKLVYSEAFITKIESVKREHFLKKQRNRSFYERLIAEYNSNK